MLRAADVGDEPFPEVPGVTWILVTASIAAFMVAQDALVVTSALNAIRLDVDASMAQLEWTVNAFALSFAILLMTGAALGERFGRRRMLVVGIGIFTVASAACAVAPDGSSLIAARAVQGVGAALVTPVALALVISAFGPGRRGWALGIYSGAIGFAGLCAPVVSGAITEHFAWHWIFWINVPIGLLTVVLTMTRVPESFGSRASPDIAGLVLITAAMAGLVWALVRAKATGSVSLEVALSLASGAVLAGAFVRWERRARQPMLRVKLCHSRAFSVGNAVSFLLFASMLSLTFFLVQFRQVGLGEAPLEAGLRLLPWTAAFFVAALTGPSLVDVAGVRATTVFGTLLQALGVGWIAFTARPDAGYVAMILPMAIAGGGAAIAMLACQRAVVGAVAPTDIGTASGTFTATRWLGGAFGVAIAVAVFDAAGGYGSPQQFNDGFVAAMIVSGCLALAGATAACALPSSRRDLLVVGLQAVGDGDRARSRSDHLPPPPMASHAWAG